MSVNERARSGVSERALMDAVDVIADMAARVRRNGPERFYAGEKLCNALFKAAEGLAIVGAERRAVQVKCPRALVRPKPSARGASEYRLCPPFFAHGYHSSCSSKAPGRVSSPAASHAVRIRFASSSARW